ncbi:hypothetical protein BSL78_17964 [Apostichopus japonicus]|uniref:SCP domain-containing protein n=1 Tax=Stichopus japonicus TaxID=307972 RepID=A0A2G8KB14_STIJA|nr:hypothetical protein BSL78_17964 [Apostichopus japonicus]
MQNDIDWLNYIDVVSSSVQCRPNYEWKDSIANIAQAWADGCSFSHNSERNVQRKLTTDIVKNLGENIAWGTSSSVEGLVQLWANEKNYYTYPDNTCEDGKECGHYKQVNSNRGLHNSKSNL